MDQRMHGNHAHTAAAMADSVEVPVQRSMRVVLRIAIGAAFALSLAACSATDSANNRIDATQSSVASTGTPSVKSKKTGGYAKLGKPYTVRGKTYYPKDEPNYSAEGIASWYGPKFHGGKTANGETFDMRSISAAHKTLPMPSYVRVTNLSNKRSIIVRVNNRGPFVGNRLIDVSHRTAELLGFAKNGVARVRVDYVGPASIDGSDHVQLAGTLTQDGTLAQPPGASQAVQVAEAQPSVTEAAETVATNETEATQEQSAQDALETQVADAQSFVPGVAEAVPTNGQGVPVPLRRPDSSATQVASVSNAGWSSGAEPVQGMGYSGQPGSESAR